MKQLRHVAIQCVITQNFKANGTYHYSYKIKRKQKSYENYKNKKNLKYFMKSRSISSNQAEKQIFEAEIVIEIQL